MDIGNFKYFFFDEKVSIQTVETPSGEYLIEVYNPSVKDINGVMFLSGKHFKNKIKHNGGNIYIQLGDAKNYCRLIKHKYNVNIKFYAHGCAKVTRLS